jgi:hypothetical protein
MKELTLKIHIDRTVNIVAAVSLWSTYGIADAPYSPKIKLQHEILDKKSGKTVLAYSISNSPKIESYQLVRFNNTLLLKKEQYLTTSSEPTDTDQSENLNPKKSEVALELRETLKYQPSGGQTLYSAMTVITNSGKKIHHNSFPQNIKKAIEPYIVSEEESVSRFIMFSSDPAHGEDYSSVISSPPVIDCFLSKVFQIVRIHIGSRSYLALIEPST